MDRPAACRPGHYLRTDSFPPPADEQAKANRGILYVDEVNLLDDGLVDVVLDSAASGVNTVEREGISIVHPAKFIMVGSGNPQVRGREGGGQSSTDERGQTTGWGGKSMPVISSLFACLPAPS